MTSTDIATETKCPGCYQPVERRDGQWYHVRSERFACVPMCDAPGCREVAKHAVGKSEFDGAGMRFIPRQWFCDAHAEGRAIWERR
jgi:hypothetical protein